MPINKFRSWGDSPSFKGRQFDAAVSMLHMNYTILASAWTGAPESQAALRVGYGKQQFDADNSTFERLAFVYYADRLRARLEDTLRIFLEDRPLRAKQINPSNPAWVTLPITVESVRPAIEKAGDKLCRGSVMEIRDRVKSTFGISILTDAETALLNYIFEARNMLVHRGEEVDYRFLSRSRSSAALGSSLKMPESFAVAMLSGKLPGRLSARLKAQSQLKDSSLG